MKTLSLIEKSKFRPRLSKGLYLVFQINTTALESRSKPKITMVMKMLSNQSKNIEF